MDQRDEWGDPIGSTPLLPPDKQQLVDALDPGTDCANDMVPDAPVPGEGERLLQVVRVVAGCLVVESTVVASADLDRLATEAATASDVVAASEATYPYIDDVAGNLTAPDPQIADQRWWLDDLEVPSLDALTVDPATPKVRVAVIDSGIDDSNPDLAGLVVGRVPWAPAPTGAPNSPEGHGTHVAGIIAAAADNGLEGRGIARHVEFLDVNSHAAASPSVSELIDWAVEHGADVINMSFCEVGSDGKVPCRDKPAGATAAAIAYARSRGVLLFASSGNCGEASYKNEKCGSVKNRLQFPAGYRGVIAVGAYGRDGSIAGFSSANASVDVSAPGVGIRSTVFGQTTSVMDGTSQATPMVTGAAAALLAHRPDINPGRILSGLFAITREAGKPGWDSEFGNGRIDPLEVAARIDTSTPVPTTPPTTLPSPYPFSTGASGELVRQLQEALSAAGYDLGDADGQFGPKTAAAVAQFQTDQGMTVSGAVDEKLFQLATSQAAKAPACTFEAVRATQGALPDGWLWNGTVDCGPGWAVASAWLPDTAAGLHYLFRVRGAEWQLANSSNGRVATNVLAAGTALSPERFAVLFGAPGWPGRVSSADQVAKFIMIDSVAASGTLPEAWEYVQMWLDQPGFDVWLNWLYGAESTGSFTGPCVFVDNTDYLGVAHWECAWSEGGGARWTIAVDAHLTRATMAFTGGE